MPSSTDLVEVKDYAALQQSPAQLNEIIKANLGNQKLSEFDLDRIGMPTGGRTKWTVPGLEGEEEVAELTGVIVHWKESRSYWTTSYEDTGGGTPPDCSSRDAVRATSTEGFDPGAPKDPDGFFLCEGCPLAVYGSDPREGSNSQACAQRRQLFLLTPEDILPVVVSLSPASLGAANKYFMRLSKAQVPYFAVVTTLTLEQHAKPVKHSRAVFKMAQRLEGDHAEKIAQYAANMRPIFDSVVPDAAEAAAA